MAAYHIQHGPINRSPIRSLRWRNDIRRLIGGSGFRLRGDSPKIVRAQSCQLTNVPALPSDTDNEFLTPPSPQKETDRISTASQLHLDCIPTAFRLQPDCKTTAQFDFNPGICIEFMQIETFCNFFGTRLNIIWSNDVTGAG